MRKSSKLSLLTVFVSTMFLFTASADARWTKQVGTFKGRPTFKDSVTGKVWTRTIGQVKSRDRGRIAAADLASGGFRLPTFGELQDMYNRNGGGTSLNIQVNNRSDYYETLDPNIRGNAFGNGFQTPLQRIGIGENWYIGVKK